MNPVFDGVIKMKSMNYLRVKRKPGRNPAAGLITFGHRTIECRLGLAGITTRKLEGDRATPAGKWRLLFGWNRADRKPFPRSLLSFRPIRQRDGWCDDPASPLYNRAVRLPFHRSHEVMKRGDRLYDICIVLDCNLMPRIRGRGSAIFFHLTSEAGKGTAGCIAIDPEEMRRLLPRLSGRTVLEILA